jgi:hypothetical protein
MSPSQFRKIIKNCGFNRKDLHGQSDVTRFSANLAATLARRIKPKGELSFFCGPKCWSYLATTPLSQAQINNRWSSKAKYRAKSDKSLVWGKMEYLVDFSAFVGRDCENMILAAESEAHTGESYEQVFYDFEKLLYVRSPNLLFVAKTRYNGRNEARGQSYQNLKYAIQSRFSRTTASLPRAEAQKRNLYCVLIPNRINAAVEIGFFRGQSPSNFGWEFL